MGIDEKSFGSGQSYISLLTDLEQSRALEMAQGCDQATAQALWQSQPQRQSVEAEDTVRRAEHKELLARGDETLKHSRQLWLFNPVHFSAEQAADFEALKCSGLKVARAWAIKELFSKLWDYRHEGSARKFFKSWFGWAARSRLRPVIKVAKMIRRHLENILTDLRHPITNTTAPASSSSAENSTFTRFKIGRARFWLGNRRVGPWMRVGTLRRRESRKIGSDVCALV